MLATSHYPESADNPSGKPRGSVLTVEFEVLGRRFTALNGGPQFAINPSISFFVFSDTTARTDALWAELAQAGKVLMPLDKYPWSERYGWVQDRFGVSWQVMTTQRAAEGSRIVPCLMFSGAQYGRAEEAMKAYTAVFPDSRVVQLERYGAQGYYIPLRPEVAESLHRGDTIRVGFKAEDWLKPADKAIAQVAKENGGVYAPREHQRELETKQATKSDADALSPANLVAGNIRRLERLVAYGLASQLPEGRWRVPSDLIAKLESRERTHSRPRLQIDKFSPAKREPAAPLITDLEKERVTIGEGAAQRLGLAFVANPQRFRGQLVPAPAGPSGTEYVQVVDYRHRQLALVPKPKDAERKKKY